MHVVCVRVFLCGTGFCWLYICNNCLYVGLYAGCLRVSLYLCLVCLWRVCFCMGLLVSMQVCFCVGLFCPIFLLISPPFLYNIFGLGAVCWPIFSFIMAINREEMF